MERIRIHDRENYFSIRALSNSRLTEVKRGLADAGYVPKPSETAFSLGSLVDALLTQRKDVDTQHPDFKKALRMKDRFLADPVCRAVYELTEKQVAYLNENEYNFMGNQGRLFCKALMDFDLPGDAYMELKTTPATTYNQFLTNVNTFDYDRAAYHYMLTGQKRECLIIGLCKVKDLPPYLLKIKHGDKLWQSGREKWNHLAFNFDLTETL